MRCLWVGHFTNIVVTFRSWKHHTVTCIKFSDPVKRESVSREQVRLRTEVEQVMWIWSKCFAGCCTLHVLGLCICFCFCTNNEKINVGNKICFMVTTGDNVFTTNLSFPLDFTHLGEFLWEKGSGPSKITDKCCFLLFSFFSPSRRR